MKEDKKVLIHSVLIHLAERDPEWKKAYLVPRFKIIYGGWCLAEIRAHRRSRDFLSRSWKRGWLPQADFIRFYMYAMQ